MFRRMHWHWLCETSSAQRLARAKRRGHETKASQPPGARPCPGGAMPQHHTRGTPLRPIPVVAAILITSLPLPVGYLLHINSDSFRRAPLDVCGNQRQFYFYLVMSCVLVKARPGRGAKNRGGVGPPTNSMKRFLAGSHYMGRRSHVSLWYNLSAFHAPARL